MTAFRAVSRQLIRFDISALTYLVSVLAYPTRSGAPVSWLAIADFGRWVSCRWTMLRTPLSRLRIWRMSMANPLATRKQCETATPGSPVKTDRKAQNYRSGVIPTDMRSKVKPLFRYLIRTCNILAMCDLRMSLERVKLAERVARKLFATIRYRFSHLDNGLIWKAA
jgi:hypothetical protein